MTDLIIRNGKADSVSKVPIVNWFKISKMMEGRKNYKKDGCVSFVPSQSNLELWKQVFPSSKIDDQDAKLKDFEAYVVAERPPFAFRRDPLPHQSKAFKQFENSKLSAVFGSVGSGKTKIAVDLMANYYCQGKIDAVVIIAINKLVTTQWHESQLKRDIGDHIPYTSWLWDKSKKGVELYENLKTSEGLQIVLREASSDKGDLRMFWRILAGFNLVANPYIGYLVYGYMWDDSVVMTLVVFFLLLQKWVDSLYHVLKGQDVRANA